MYFRVLAEEEKNTVTVLNYAPGPLVTDMLPQILQQALPEIQQKFHGKHYFYFIVAVKIKVSAYLQRESFEMPKKMDFL